MKDEQDSMIRDFQQEVAAYWETFEGVTVDKTDDGGLVLNTASAGRVEYSPEDVQNIWMALKPDRFIVGLHYLVEWNIARYVAATKEERIAMFEGMELYARMARKTLEHPILE